MSESDLEQQLALSSSGEAMSQEKETKTQTKRKRSVWVQPLLKERPTQGANSDLNGESEEEDLGEFKNFPRLFPIQFRRLEELVTPLIRRCHTNYRAPITPRERLMITLRFLLTGETYRSLSLKFRVGSSTIQQLVPDTCRAIYQVLKEKFMNCPNNVDEWLHVSSGFQTQWDFPNCLGALEGKHVSIRSPPRSAKHSNCIELMALVDSNYKFLYVDVGRVSDGCTFQGTLERRIMNIPAPAPLPGTDQLAPFTVIADEAFPLQESIMTPYPNGEFTVQQQLFNYRLSRARRVADNAFGILASRFRVLRTTLPLHPERVERIVMACCVLHNFLQSECSGVYLEDIVDREDKQNFIPGRWRDDQPSLKQAFLPHNSSRSVMAEWNRDILSHYFNTEAGSLPFQWDKI